jgi:hypothetical protein
MPIRSHVDPCLFIRFIYIEGADVPVDVLTAIEGAPDQERYFRAWRAQYEATPHLIFHESYHFWQGLRLPYLYWYALLSFRAVIQGFAGLDEVADVHEWGAFVPALYRLQMPIRLFHVDEANLAMSTGPGAPDEFREEILVAPLDLIEAAASLAEFQVGVASSQASDVVTFNRWRKRTPSYTRLIRFVARTLGREDVALRCLLPMINVAFTTTDPPRAFFWLLTILKGNVANMDAFLAQPEPCRWGELFEAWLEKHVEFEADPDSTTDVLKPPFCRLTLEKWIGASLEHPVLTKTALAWSAAQEDEPTYGWMLGQPAWVTPDAFWKAQEAFEPTTTVVRFDLPGENNRVFAMQREELSFDIRDLLTLWSVMRRAAKVHIDPDHRLCHHVACPEYALNYCNSYPIIPASYDKCGFRPRLERLRAELREMRGRAEERPDGAADDLG